MRNTDRDAREMSVISIEIMLWVNIGSSWLKVIGFGFILGCVGRRFVTVFAFNHYFCNK